MSFDNNQTFWKEFMVLYREKPCLWDIKSKEYRNKSLKNVAYSSLIKKSKELFPEANKDFVTKKISSFRSSFRRQVRRIENAKRGGATEEVPEITLWYFDLLLFLLDEEERTKIMSYVKGTNYDEKIEGTAIQTRASRKRYQNIEISSKILQEKRCMKGKEEATFIRNVGQQLAELASKQKMVHLAEHLSEIKDLSKDDENPPLNESSGPESLPASDDNFEEGENEQIQISEEVVETEQVEEDVPAEEVST
ncbi:hypothetical protein MML48_6g00009506 [Holotrichia oblita]|uniref:Uncharacterized protein n=1 Tax=Holotrichia oblita TaxID=644536 RepID=A0ACB9SWN5_HOLOL|nr:hypothetical protein MML48_6g00009506 [Holotrichia oblita]